MKEKRNITIIDKKQIPSEEPARQYYFMDIAKKYVAELACLLYTSPSPPDLSTSRMPSSA